MTARPQRDRYQGMLQILRFNWPKYLAAGGFMAVAGCAWPMLPTAGRDILLAATVPVVWWTLASLLISHCVYDRSHFYDLAWLQNVLGKNPRRWLSIHGGLDETSSLLRAVFPHGSGEVADIFDPNAMTEDSIRQARRAQRNPTQSAPAHFYSLPYASGSFEAVFCIFAAHELRRHADRVRLFTELARLLTPGGVLVLVEHLRDWPNFLAFGPGFLHFHSWRAWQKATDDAGLACGAEFPFTPFVRVAVFGRAL